MRKLILFLCLAFAVYYGSSLWQFTDAASYMVVANWMPLGLMLAVFLVGLVHLPTALGASLALIVLLGNPQLLDGMATGVFGCDDRWALFGALAKGNPTESIVLGLFAAWILVRFFGNPELDYEYTRSNTVRALHFPVGVLCAAAVLSAFYAVVQNSNVFSLTFSDNLRDAAIRWPFGVLQGGGGIEPVRAVVRLVECVAVYTIVVNEIRTARQVGAMMWTMLVTALIVVALGLVQQRMNIGYTNIYAKINLEMQSTFAEPNSCAVYLLALLPMCLVMMVRGRALGVAGVLCGAVLVGGIVLTDTKSAILVALLLIVATMVWVVVRAVCKRTYWPLVLSGILLVLVVAGYATAKIVHRSNKDKDVPWASMVVKKIDGTAEAFCRGPWTKEALNERSKNKLADYCTAMAMASPFRDGAMLQPVTGVGFGQFAAKHTTYRVPWSASNRDGASNMVLHLLAENGVFCALALVLVIGFAMAGAFGASRAQGHASLAVVTPVLALALLVAGCMTENAFLRMPIQVVFWMLVGLCMVVASLTVRDEVPKDMYTLKFLTVVLMLGMWGYSMYAPMKKQYDESRVLRECATAVAETQGHDVIGVLKSFEKARDFNFNEIDGDRWSGADGLVLTHATGPILSGIISFANPSVTPENPLIVRLFIDDQLIKETTFTKGERMQQVPLLFGHEAFEVDISKNAKLVDYVVNSNNVVLRMTVNRTFVPGDVNASWKERGWTFEVGASLKNLAWNDTMKAPVPPRTEEPAADTNAPAASSAEPVLSNTTATVLPTPVDTNAPAAAVTNSVSATPGS